MRELSRAELRACCASAAWADAVAGAGPYAGLEEMAHASDRVIAELAWADVEEALAAHPRIGERAAGDAREAAWSRQEQSGAAGAGQAVLDDLRSGNEAYERRFGHVYLVCATGRGAEEIRDILLARLDNDAETERAVVRAELAKIVKIRLAKIENL
ncbi:2-oxo-4-hydroxy-4-carboxy-5-ureidoimidazoline decarboxylase [Streptosporangiaceae bacterium NEAU-GS5]|nr:2-oxo-4-hydroxy-4-carboxy-5-ureidoimidazoline decarboxylase [Streptosporangiaceae bacterium NEAU-GS5]